MRWHAIPMHIVVSLTLAVMLAAGCTGSGPTTAQSATPATDTGDDGGPSAAAAPAPTSEAAVSDLPWGD